MGNLIKPDSETEWNAGCQGLRGRGKWGNLGQRIHTCNYKMNKF